MQWWKYVLIGIPVLLVIIYFGLPSILHVPGLHPSYDIPPFDLKGKRALVITTSHGTLGDTGKATGVFGSEMSVPYYAFLDAGMEVVKNSIPINQVESSRRPTRTASRTRDDARCRRNAGR